MRKLILFLLAGCLSSFPAAAQLPGSWKADTLFHDFETGELFAWEQYPYAQDIGFDALYFARQTPTLHNSRFALAHPVKAYDTHELYQGFTRRLNMIASAGAGLDLGIYLQSDRAAKELEISLGTRDGKRYFYRLPRPQANEWIKVQTPLSAFKNGTASLPLNSELEAITVQAYYDTTYYLYTYTILMDDVRITGARPRRLVAQTPSSVYFAEFNKTIIPEPVAAGAPLALSVAAEDGIALRSVTGRLYAPDGSVAADQVVFKEQSGVWSNPSVFAKARRLPPGISRLDLVAPGKNGDTIRTSLELIVADKPVQGHPRLFFSPGSLAARRAAGEPAGAKAILEKAMRDSSYLAIPLNSIEEGKDRTGENLVGGPYAQNTVGFDAYGEWHKPMATLEKIIETCAFRYSLGGDAKAGQLGKEALLKFCRFKKWNCDWMLNRRLWTYYPVGYAIKAVAYGYDMLYDLLSEPERQLVREAMMNKGLKLFHRDMVEMNRMPSNLTNHISVLVTGFGLAATAMYGDDPSMRELPTYLAGMITKARAFIGNTYYADGSYGEPKSGYMDMATRDIAELIAGLEQVFGIDLSTTTNVENFYKFPLQATDASGLIPAYGDGGRSYSGFTQEHGQWFVHRTGNPYLYQFVKPFWEAGNGGFLGYLWYRNDLQPKDRSSLPPSRPFEAQGMVMRSGWDDHSTVISTRTGPHSNHYHFDQGSFQVMTNGEELLTDPGIGTGGYYMNTEYLSYNTQSIAHNVLLVDHDPGSQIAAHFDNGIRSLSEWPTMSALFNGGSVDAVTASLATVYKGKLDGYERKLVYRKNGPIFLWDQVTARKGEMHVYDWLFHVPQMGQQRTCSYENNRFLLEQPKARLTMDIVYPSGLSASIRDRNGNTNSYLNYNSKTFSESFLTVSTVNALPATDFLAVIVPEPVTGTPLSPLPATESLSGAGWIGARFTRGNEEDIAYCRTGDDRQLPLNGIQTDASFLLLSKTAGAFTCFFEGKQLQTDNWHLVADKDLSLAATATAGSRQLEIETAVPAAVRVKINGRLSALRVNGAPAKTSVKDGWLTIPAAAGKTTVYYETK